MFQQNSRPAFLTLLLLSICMGSSCRLNKKKHDIKKISESSAAPEDIPKQIASFVKQVTDEYVEERGDKVLTESEHSELDTAAFNIDQMKTDDLSKILSDPEIEATVRNTDPPVINKNGPEPTPQETVKGDQPEVSQGVATDPPQKAMDTTTSPENSIENKSGLQRDLMIGFGVGLTTLTIGALAGWGLSNHLKSKEAKLASADSKKRLDEAYSKLSDSQKKNLDLSNRYSALQKSHMAAQKELEKAQAAIDGLKQDLRNSQLSNQQLRTNLESMKLSLEEAMNNYRDVQIGLGNTNQSLQEARNMVLQKEARIMELEDSIVRQMQIEVELNEKLTSALSNSDTQVNEISALKKLLEESRDSTQAALSAKLELEGKLKVAETKLIEATESNSLLKSRLQDASESMSRVSTALKGMGVDLGKVQRDGTDITRLEKQLVEDIVSIRKGINLEALQNNVELEKQVAQWQLKLDEAADNGRAIIQKLQVMESDHIKLLQKNVLLELEAKAANQKLVEVKLYAEDLEKQIEAATKSLSESNQSRILLADELASLKSQHSDALKIIKSLETNSNDLNRQLRDATELEKQLKSQIDVSGQKVLTLTSENEALSNKLRETNDLLSAAQSKHLELESALIKAESERVDALRRVEELDESLRSTQKNLETAEEALVNTRKRILEVQQAIEKATGSKGSLTELQDELTRLYEAETSKVVELKKMEARYSVLSQEFFQNYNAHVLRQNQAIEFYSGLGSGKSTVESLGSGLYERTYTVGDRKFVATFESYTTLRNLGNFSLTNYELKEIKVVDGLGADVVKVKYDGKATAYQKILELEGKLQKKGIPDMMQIYHQLETDFEFYKTEDLSSGLLKTNVTAYGDITNVNKGVVLTPLGKVNELKLEQKKSMSLLLGQVQDYMGSLSHKPDMTKLFKGSRLAPWSQIQKSFSPEDAKMINELVGGNYNDFYSRWTNLDISKSEFSRFSQLKSQSQLLGDFQMALKYKQSSLDMQSVIRQNQFEIETRKIELEDLLTKISRSVTLTKTPDQPKDPAANYLYKLSLIETYWFQKIRENQTPDLN